MLISDIILSVGVMNIELWILSCYYFVQAAQLQKFSAEGLSTVQQMLQNASQDYEVLHSDWKVTVERVGGRGRWRWYIAQNEVNVYA